MKDDIYELIIDVKEHIYNLQLRKEASEDDSVIFAIEGKIRECQKFVSSLQSILLKHLPPKQDNATASDTLKQNQ